jgi:hypothetical protein
MKNCLEINEKKFFLHFLGRAAYIIPGFREELTSSIDDAEDLKEWPLYLQYMDVIIQKSSTKLFCWQTQFYGHIANV